jgi:energy-coupling factor transporter ATP-binding protein EcfA2
MNTTEQGLIRLNGVTKVFYTDEVETHALSGVHLEIKNGEFLSIAGPSGCGKSTLLSILGLLDSPTEGRLLDQYPGRGESFAVGSHAHPQSRDRLRLSGLQPDRRPHRLRKRGTPADLSQHGGRRTQEARAGSSRTSRHGAPHEALPVAALRRSTAARRGGPRAGRLTLHLAGGRTDRKPRFEKQRGGGRTVAANSIVMARRSAWSLTIRDMPVSPIVRFTSSMAASSKKRWAHALRRSNQVRKNMYLSLRPNTRFWLLCGSVFV